jgi:hypothetical protein
MNAFYAEEVALDGIFHTDATDRDSIAGDAATNRYKNKIAMVTAQADQTPVSTQGRIANIVRRWRLKFEFTPGKFRNLPQRGPAPSFLITFFTRAVAGAVIDLMIHVQTEDFFIDPNPGAVVTYRTLTTSLPLRSFELLLGELQELWLRLPSTSIWQSLLHLSGHDTSDA